MAEDKQLCVGVGAKGLEGVWKGCGRDVEGVWKAHSHPSPCPSFQAHPTSPHHIMQINSEFNQFVKRVQEVWEKDYSDLQLEFDIPFRELGFHGTPFK